MKTSLLKKFMLAASGLVAFQVAGCNVLDTFQELLSNIPVIGG